MDYSRQRELFDPTTFNTPVHIIGAGAVGSWLTLMLAKLGVEDITIYDFDKVEMHNLPNQAFHLRSVGEYKVKSLAGIIGRHTNREIKISTEEVTGDTPLEGIVFMLVDTMKAREEIYHKAIKYKMPVKLLIESRMGFDSARVYVVPPMDVEANKRYSQTLYKDDESHESVCGSSQSVVTTAVHVASTCVRQLINYHNGVDLPNEILIDYLTNDMEVEKWSA